MYNLLDFKYHNVSSSLSIDWDTFYWLSKFIDFW